MYELPENLDIYSIEESRQELLNYIDKKIENGENEVIIDGSRTEDIDAAGLQILISAFKTVKDEGLEWNIINKTDMLSNLLLFSGGKEMWRGSGNE